jgi:tetratricopeptide (TPR) repeat protein
VSTSRERATTLRQAEKLLRDGQLELALAEYLRVLDEHPRDSSTANAVGDLHLRMGQADRALEYFVQAGDVLFRDGFFAKAGAIYKKVLKLDPDHEHALLHAADAARRQGRFADARAHLTVAVDRRMRNDDADGAKHIRIRLYSVDPADFAARQNAVGLRVEIGDVAGAVGELKKMAAELEEKGRDRDAMDALGRAAELAPDDEEIRTKLAGASTSSEAVADVEPVASEAAASAEPSIADELPTDQSPTAEEPPTVVEPATGLEPLASTEPPAPGAAPPTEEPRIDDPQADKPTSVDARAAVSAPKPIATDDIDDVFTQMRDEASRRLTGDASEGEYKRALILREAGDIDGCIDALTHAVNSPKVRVAAASLLAQLYKLRGDAAQARHWSEQATRAEG